MESTPIVTVAIPSYNHGRYLDKAIESVFLQDIPVEVFVVDGGSTDNSLEIIKKWESRLAGWRYSTDAGQSAAINEAIEKGRAPYVCWLNSDDWFLPNGLIKLVDQLSCDDTLPMLYGRTWNYVEHTGKMHPALVRPFTEWMFAQFCYISQPGTLIRRSAWEAVGGLDENLQMAMDYDLWWRIEKQLGTPKFINEFVAVNREHSQTKTNTQRRLHYKEAMNIVQRHYGSLPIKWWLTYPYSVWYRSIFRK